MAGRGYFPAMPATLEQIVADTLALPEKEQYQLLKTLEARLVEVADPSWQPSDEEKAEWDRRAAELRADKSKGLTISEFMAGLGGSK